MPKIADDWWRQFRDPELDRLEAEALAHNLDLAEAFARIDEARASLRSARAQQTPDATVKMLGERVEVEQIQYGPRYVWVEGTILDFRTAAYRERLHRNPRALDYLVRDRDGEERWHADERIRKKARR